MRLPSAPFGEYLPSYRRSFIFVMQPVPGFLYLPFTGSNFVLGGSLRLSSGTDSVLSEMPLLLQIPCLSYLPPVFALYRCCAGIYQALFLRKHALLSQIRFYIHTVCKGCCCKCVTQVVKTYPFAPRPFKY